MSLISNAERDDTFDPDPLLGSANRIGAPREWVVHNVSFGKPGWITLGSSVDSAEIGASQWGQILDPVFSGIAMVEASQLPHGLPVMDVALARKAALYALTRKWQTVAADLERSLARLLSESTPPFDPQPDPQTVDSVWLESGLAFGSREMPGSLASWYGDEADQE